MEGPLVDKRWSLHLRRDKYYKEAENSARTTSAQKHSRTVSMTIVKWRQNSPNGKPKFCKIHFRERREKMKMNSHFWAGNFIQSGWCRQISEDDNSRKITVHICQTVAFERNSTCIGQDTRNFSTFANLRKNVPHGWPWRWSCPNIPQIR